MRTILIVIYLFFYFLLGLPVLGAEWIISRFNKPLADIQTLRIVQWGFRCILFISGVRLEVEGHEHVPEGEAVLYIGNHRGFFDVVATYSLCPSLTGYIAKSGIDRVPVLNLFMKRIYCLFLERDDVKQGLQVILQAISYVKSGISICIFPEGTRNKDREHPDALLPFKEGSFKIAQKTGCKIIPMAIHGSADILENHFPWVHKGTIRIRYGEPIIVSELEKEQQKKLGAYCRDIIAEMLNEN